MKRNSMKFFAAGVAAIAFSGSPALATDLPKPRVITKAPVKAPDPTWTGFYLGANAGVGVSQTRATTDDEVGSIDRAGVGFAGGGQIGFNWQFAPHWVAGVEADIGYLGIDRSFTDIEEPVVFGVKTDWYGTVRGRLGYTNGPSLFYATGGLAYVKVTNNFDDLDNNVFASRTETARGWTAGGGIETMLGGNWSAKVEYLYIDAGSQDVLLIVEALDQDTTARFKNRFHVFRYGLNYRFGGSGIPVALPAHNWAGFYTGVNAGASLSQVHVRPQNGAMDIADHGITAGVQVGYNWHSGSNWVTGVEADIGWLGVDRSFLGWEESSATGVKADWYGTLRARLGYSTGPALIYLTGGGALVNVKNSNDTVTPAPQAVSQSEVAAGWTVGGGIEAALTAGWTAKTEYLYIDAGHQQITTNGLNFDNRFHVFRFGLNRKFGS